MEPQPKAEAEQKPDQDQKPDLKTGDDDNHHPTDSAKGNATDEAGAVTGSEEISARSVDHLHPPERTGSARKSVHWSPELVTGRSSGNDNGSINGTVLGDGSNPYITSSPAPASPSFSIKETMWSVKDTLGRWGKKVGEATKKAEDLAGNTWQHLKTGPSFADAALGRIAQGTKILAEGGYENVFRQTFETAPEEQLQNAFACYLSTSAGPVMGILYVSTEKLGFCSDNPLSYKSDNGQVEWSYYKVVIPLHQIKAINPSTSRTNPTEKYVQVISVDNLEFWFMGFLNYGGAVQCLKDASQACGIQTA